MLVLCKVNYGSPRVHVNSAYYVMSASMFPRVVMQVVHITLSEYYNTIPITGLLCLGTIVFLLLVLSLCLALFEIIILDKSRFISFHKLKRTFSIWRHKHVCLLVMEHVKHFCELLLFSHSLRWDTDSVLCYL